MARKRFVSPKFFKHAELHDAEVASGLPLRIAFAALWCQCDRRGLFAWKPRELKTECLPYDPCDFANVLSALERAGFVESYIVNGKKYGCVPTLRSHQSFHKDEKPDPLLPDRPAVTIAADVGALSPQHGVNTVLAPPQHGACSTIAVAVTGSTTSTSTTNSSRRGGRKTAATRTSEPKWPDFPAESRAELHSYWQAKIGTVHFPVLVNAIGPYWRPPNDLAAVRTAVRDYCALIPRGRSAPFASPADLAKKLGALIDNATRNANDAVARMDAADTVIHGKQAA